MLCKQGNDSQKAVQVLDNVFLSRKVVEKDNVDPEKQAENDLSKYDVIFKDIKGGLIAWAKQIDSTLPQY